MMRTLVRTVVAFLIILTGAVMLIWVVSDYQNARDVLSLFVFIIGFFMVFFGLGILFYKPRSKYDLPPEHRIEGPKSEEDVARDRKESGVLISMTVPMNNEYGHAPPGDGMPAKPLEWWK